MFYKWADNNLMQFNERMFKQMSYEETRNVGKRFKKLSLNLGVLISRNLFSEHIDNLILSN